MSHYINILCPSVFPAIIFFWPERKKGSNIISNFNFTFFVLASCTKYSYIIVVHGIALAHSHTHTTVPVCTVLCVYGVQVKT